MKCDDCQEKDWDCVLGVGVCIQEQIRFALRKDWYYNRRGQRPYRSNFERMKARLYRVQANNLAVELADD
jgi:hypothetical protein